LGFDREQLAERPSTGLLHQSPSRIASAGLLEGFELAVRAIVGQQVSVKGASTLSGRLAAKFGQPFHGPADVTRVFPSPKSVAGAKLASIGLPQARAATIRALACAVSDGRIDFENVDDSAEFLDRLQQIPGMGKWTAADVALRALGEPDAFPSSDLGLRRALGLHNPLELERRAEAWRPWRAYAAMHLWSMPNHKPTSRKPSRSFAAVDAASLAPSA
jgi:AraC family transcriptional regulator, regulatory protein of adaptative response / DNA-3-methyladenine glycosylase II